MEHKEKTLDIDTSAGTVQERDATPEEQIAPKGMLKSLKDVLASIAAAVSSDQISTRQAREIRARLGVSQAYFTRKTLDRKKRARLHAIQKASRKANRRKTKGLLNRKGQRYTRQT